jgi:hypothetical protein
MLSPISPTPPRGIMERDGALEAAGSGLKDVSVIAFSLRDMRETGFCPLTICFLGGIVNAKKGVKYIIRDSQDCHSRESGNPVVS